MDRGKRSSNVITNRNNKIYMDLKDIIREQTLPFLPAKSLFRFKSVCRDWKLQISTPFFAHNQSNSFHEFSGFFCHSCSHPPKFFSLDPDAYGVPDPSLQFLPEPVEIKTSSNGLLCCQGQSGDKPYYICNPVTKQWKKLPKPNANHESDPALVLMFEPSLLNFVAEYKLICAFPSADFDNACEFEIYSSAEGSWRISGEIYFGARKLIANSGVHVNGIVYWLSETGGIVVFDLTMERSQRLYGHNGCLGVMNGKLTSTTAYNQSLTVSVLSNPYTNTMAMNSRVKTWDTKLSINVNDRSDLRGISFTESQPQGYSFPGSLSYNKGAVLFASGDFIVFRCQRTVYSYDMKTQQVRRLSSEADDDIRVLGYVNSLVEI